MVADGRLSLDAPEPPDAPESSVVPDLLDAPESSDAPELPDAPLPSLPPVAPVAPAEDPLDEDALEAAELDAAPSAGS
ncbi:MAG TPA: hypothetical protein VGP78_06695 [Solirubrobacteraceae bacterium]|nr:hypothetical protein [Solirubrobacteraceae bacterium]